ncbi:sporulation membrane protein YtaF [Lacrimispora defluvii]|uniref:Sporulation membrane protein YtaF n=1 Tax=Lacrimispora defluvii TaxID=2719233 RepID=A0ABX1VUE2_9FIRM|nr:sporulation membrane protein YtaF [Lacrimispora defluvii]NNJ32054.1 sporulation membrane protein YtaF [Lacrimispora defluvii]
MLHLLLKIVESVLFVIALSTDALISSLAYGSNKIKIPFLSVQIIAFLCTGILGISLLLGVILMPHIPGELLKLISFLILLFLGITRLMDNIIKMLINKHATLNKEFQFSIFNLNFILHIYANPKEADLDQSKTLSSKEAFTLGLALSIDSMAAGVGAALGNINIVSVILSSLILSNISIKLGEFIGRKISDKVPIQISWLGGILLITLAFLRIL